jgi:hypothetical protein
MLAAQKFREQMVKAGVTVSVLREAKLEITKPIESHSGVINGQTCIGHDLRFVVKVISIYGKIYECQLAVFVAPHDAEVELRSIRDI